MMEVKRIPVCSHLGEDWQRGLWAFTDSLDDLIQPKIVSVLSQGKFMVSHAFLQSLFWAKLWKQLIFTRRNSLSLRWTEGWHTGFASFLLWVWEWKNSKTDEGQRLAECFVSRTTEQKVANREAGKTQTLVCPKGQNHGEFQEGEVNTVKGRLENVKNKGWAKRRSDLSRKDCWNLYSVPFQESDKEGSWLQRGNEETNGEEMKAMIITGFF